MSHLFHNCAERIRSKFDSVDNLISRLKAATIKNKERKLLFRDIGFPPTSVITRWTSWLKVAIYYADNLPKSRLIVGEFTGDGLIVTRAKDSLKKESLSSDLLHIKRDYENLITLVENSERTTYYISNAYQDLQNIQFGEDLCDLSTYVKKRLMKNKDIYNIMNLTKNDISPSQ